MPPFSPDYTARRNCSDGAAARGPVNGRPKTAPVTYTVLAPAIASKLALRPASSYICLK